MTYVSFDFPVFWQMIKVIHEAYSGYLSFYYSQIRHDFYDAVVGYVI